MKLIFNESLLPATPYMIRNDGKVFTCGDTHPYITIDLFKGVKDTVLDLFKDNFDNILWFHDNTARSETKNAIEKLVSMFIFKFCTYFGLSVEEVDEIRDKVNFRLIPIESSIDQFINLFFDVDKLCNQEFLRARTSNILYGGNNNSIYFRISSVGFDWFDIIWNFVNENKSQISDVTIVKDSRTFGGRYTKYGEFDHMPIDEFLTLSGNPVLETSYGDNIFNIIEEGIDYLAQGDLRSHLISEQSFNKCESNYLKRIFNE